MFSDRQKYVYFERVFNTLYIEPKHMLKKFSSEKIQQ